MAKPRIDAKQALLDIRSGLDDHRLMEKYNLSSKGLESLFQKLVRAGLLSQTELDNRKPWYEDAVDLDTASTTLRITWKCPYCGNYQPGTEKCLVCGEELPELEPHDVKPEIRSPIPSEEVVADIKSGMSDAELIVKYGITAHALQGLYDKLINAGLVRMADIQHRLPAYEETVDVTGKPAPLFDWECPACGVAQPKTQTCISCGVNVSQFLVKQRLEKWKQDHSIKERVKDIRAGKSDEQLIHKYSLGAGGLKAFFQDLIDEGLITREEIDKRNELIAETTSNSDDTLTVTIDWSCPACGVYQPKSDVCLECGVNVNQYLVKQRMAKWREERMRSKKKSLASGD